jgi:WD40 repeat protein/transcriptional regulator with XRE-family HTH domain
MPDDAFARALRERRRALDMTQADFANRVGCATITLKRIETGTLRPSRQLAERMLRLLELPPAEREELVRRARQARTSEKRNPYKGLQAFGEDDSADFFGREALVTRLLARLAPPKRFLAVIGPSGSGKSSVVRAGLVPALRHSRPSWRAALITPGTRSVETLDTALARSPNLLVVDQFEELWALCPYESERARFLERLLALHSAPYGPLMVVTLRADFYDRPLRYHAFGTLLREHTEVVLPLAPDEIARAVARPAEHAGLSVEPALVAVCIADVEQRPGALPLLQYALTELFEQHTESSLTLADYRALGGIAGALAGRAEELFAALEADQQAIVRQVFLRLVQPGEGGETTRRRALLGELPGGEDAAHLVELFTRHRLLTLDGAETSGIAELAHEALIDGWTRLHEWVETYRDELRTHRRLAQAASDWRTAEHDQSFLARGAQLIQLEALTQIDLNAAEHAYVAASIAERERLAAEERAHQEALREALAQSEARRLAAEALKLLRENGSAELIALLALKSLGLRYTPQGDEALCGAAQLDLPLRHFLRHTGRVYCVAYGPDGQSVISGGQDQVIRQWDPSTGAELRQLEGHTHNVRGLAYSSDSRFIASAADDDTARVWDAQTGALLYTLRHTANLDGVAFAPTSYLLVTWGVDSRLQVWDGASGALLQIIDTAVPRIRAATWSPDGAWIVACLSDGRMQRFSAGNGSSATLTNGLKIVTAVCYAPDGRSLFTAHPNGCVAHQWDAETGALLQTFQGHADLVHHVACAPDGRTVVTSGNDSTSRVWDVATATELRRFAGHGNLIWRHALSSDGRLLITGGLDGTVSLWSLAQLQRRTVLRGHSGAVMGAVYTADGCWIATAGEDKVLRVWDSATGEQLSSYHVLPNVLMHGGVACMPNSRSVILACDDGIARLVDLTNGTVTMNLMGHDGRIWGVAASPDGRYLLTTGADRLARLWGAESGELLYTLVGHTDMVVGAAFSPDSRFAVTGSDDGTVRLWDVTSGAEVHRLTDPRFPMVYAAVDPHGLTVLTGSGDGSVRLWDLASAREYWRVPAHQGFINGIQISPDGRLGLSAGQDRVAKVWELESGTELRRLAGHTSSVYGVSFAPSGSHILTCSGDHSARIWQLEWHDTAEQLRARLQRGFTTLERAQYGIDG